MENEITAHKAGTIAELPITEGAPIQAGAPIATIVSADALRRCRQAEPSVSARRRMIRQLPTGHGLRERLDVLGVTGAAARAAPVGSSRLRHAAQPQVGDVLLRSSAAGP